MLRKKKIIGKNNDSAINLLQVLFFAGFLVLVTSLIVYQIVKGDYYFQRAKNNYVRLIPLPATRGSIFDRNGVELAYDKASFNISVVPYQIRNKKEELFKRISGFLDYDLDSINKAYKNNLRSLFAPVDIIIDLEKTTALELKEKFSDSIFVNPQPKRYYPYSDSLAHILGYVKEATSQYERLKKYGYSPLERVGFLGLEQYYDTYLKGEDGGDSIEVDALGRVVGFLGKQLPKKGKDIQLTIDKNFQEVASEVLEGEKGVIILMDSLTGEIITLVSAPSFNPNYFIEGEGVAKFLRSKDSPLLNRAIQSMYPMGSTFKPIVALAALEEEVVNPYKEFDCQGRFKLGPATFGCMHVHGKENMYQALPHSCNIYFYNLGLLLGPDKLSKWAKKFGLDSLTEIDLPYEKKGFIPTVKWKKRKLKRNWYAGDTVNFSIGQGFVNVTPLGVTVAINAFANGGYLVTPHILKKVDNKLSALQDNDYLDIGEEKLSLIKQTLRKTVSWQEGTANLLNRLDLGLAGKTGTAQTRGRAHGWFVGFFPYKSPKYTIGVFLENAGSSYQALKATYHFLKQAKEKDLL